MKPSRKAVCWCIFSRVPPGSSCQQQDAAVLKPAGRAARSASEQESEGDCKREHPALLPSPFELWQPPRTPPTSAPCPSLPCLSLLNAAESLQLLLVATKIFNTFCIKRGSPDRERQDTGQWLPRFLPTTLTAMSLTSMKERKTHIAFSKICIPPCMKRVFFFYFSEDAHFRDRNQISLIPHFATENMTVTSPDDPGCRCDMGQ